MLDSMYSLLSKKPKVQTDEFYKVWAGEITSYVEESILFMDYILTDIKMGGKRWKALDKPSFRIYSKELISKLDDDQDSRKIQLIQKIGVKFVD